MMISVSKNNFFIVFLAILIWFVSYPVASQGEASGTSSLNSESSIDTGRYIDDAANIITSEYYSSIVSDCKEIETGTNIRVFIKTQKIVDISEAQKLVDSFFSEWIRTINTDKRGILLYAFIPEGTLQGKIYLRVGIGLKYLITKEMGENILNKVILPNNQNNKDGTGFAEGIKAIKLMLLDDLKRETPAKTTETPTTFDLKEFLWFSKEVLIIILVAIFIFYIVFFIERCPKCNAALKVTTETLKEPGDKTLGLQRKIYTCERCGYSRRKKEPVYPSGWNGWVMRMTGTRRNIKIE